MTLINEPLDHEAGPTPSVASRSQRAGLRIAPTEGEPTSIFAVVEMAILVIVAALAMVAIIVSSGETESGGQGYRSFEQVDGRMPRDRARSELGSAAPGAGRERSNGAAA